MYNVKWVVFHYYVIFQNAGEQVQKFKKLNHEKEKAEWPSGRLIIETWWNQQS